MDVKSHTQSSVLVIAGLWLPAYLKIIYLLLRSVKRHKMATTVIKCTKNLYNNGKCFTKGHRYDVNGIILTEASLIEKEVFNDMGQKHRIGSWWRNFKLIK